MKTLIENATGESKYIFADEHQVSLLGTYIQTEGFLIGDLNASTATLYENVTPPEDWVGCKYLFDGTDWTLNPSWVDPTPQPQPQPE